MDPRDFQSPGNKVVSSFHIRYRVFCFSRPFPTIDRGREIDLDRARSERLPAHIIGDVVEEQPRRY